MSATPSPRQHYRALVAEVAARAKAILPQAVNGRLESAVKLVLSGDVEPQADGSVKVGSSDPTRYYVLQGHACTCTDFTQGKAPEGWCKHRISAGIQKRVGELVAQSPRVETEPVLPLPEAPASLNFRAMVGQFEVQLTLRDADETRLLARMAALVKQGPLKPLPPPAPRQGGQWRKAR